MEIPRPESARPIGRLMRHEHTGATSRWRPVGDPLSPFAHAPPDATLAVAPWVVPRDLAARKGDVVVVGEVAHQLLTPCDHDDTLYDELAQQTLLFHPPDAARAWLAGVELWIGVRLPTNQPWPKP